MPVSRWASALSGKNWRVMHPRNRYCRQLSLNNDAGIDGILVQLPLPEQVDADRIIAAVRPKKDVDGFHPLNLGLLFSARPRFVPCTPQGIMTLLAEYRISLQVPGQSLSGAASMWAARWQHSLPTPMQRSPCVIAKQRTSLRRSAG